MDRKRNNRHILFSLLRFSPSNPFCRFYYFSSMKKLLLILLIVPFLSFSQNYQEKDSLHIESDKIKRISAGIKFGLPYMAVLGAQFTLPFFNNHFAPYFDYSQYSYMKNEEDAKFRFSEFGLSYFFKEMSKGLYLGVSNSNLNYKVNFMNIDLENGSKGSGSGKVDMRTTCLLYTSPSPRDSDSSRMPSSA